MVSACVASGEPEKRVNVPTPGNVDASPLETPRPVPGNTSASGITPADITPAGNAGAGDPLKDARFTVAMRGAPLPRMLSLLETTIGVRFHYAAPPDAIIYSAFHNAPLLTTLEDLLYQEGFLMQRSGQDVCVLPSARPAANDVRSLQSAAKGSQGISAKSNKANVGTPNSSSRVQSPVPVAPVAWYYWTGATPPTGEWTVAPEASTSKPGVKTQQKWQPARLQSDVKHRPAFQVHEAPALVTASAKQAGSTSLPQPPAPGQAESNVNGTAKPVWLRWPLTLRYKPPGAQLLLETPAEATFYVNGAPLLRRWKGTRMVDLSQVLQVGINHLAIYWPYAPQSINSFGADNIGQHTPKTPNNVPLLNYEWFFTTTPSGRASGEAASGNLVIAGPGRSTPANLSTADTSQKKSGPLAGKRNSRP